MTILDKISMYEFDSMDRKLAAWYVLTKAAYQGKDLNKVFLVFDRFGGVHLMETK